MSRLVIISNRVADLEKSTQSGGLAVALGDALREAGGIWFGWDGNLADEDAPIRVKEVHYEDVSIATIPLTRRDYSEYYLGFSNNVLWPACHYRLDLVKFETAYFEGYKRVNAMFAEVLYGLLKPGDTIWVHDYHLMACAAELRKHGVSDRIGFFLHIPWPPPDVLMAVPAHEWLVRTLLEYDVIGFQTSTDLSNFRRYVIDQCNGVLNADGTLTVNNRTVLAKDFPIGIDVDTFSALSQTKSAHDMIERLNRRTMARAHILGVDRLDYTKGLPARFNAFKRLLEMYPQNRKGVTLMQIAPPTREDVTAYSDIRMELEGLSGAINGEFGDFDWTPVRYIHRSMSRETLAALYRGSQVGLVTPLRDGMNLVAKEYIAAQSESDPGVLVLSQFAGAAEDLQEALIVNPYDTDEVANAMQRALTMPVQERRERWRALRTRVEERNVTAWRESFLASLRKAA